MSELKKVFIEPAFDIDYIDSVLLTSPAAGGNDPYIDDPFGDL